MPRNYTTPYLPGRPMRHARTGALSRGAAALMSSPTATNFMVNAASALGPAGRMAALGYQAYRAIRGARTVTRQPRSRVVQQRGRAAGKFKKPKKGGKISMAKKLGAVVSHEQFGRIEDPDLTCIGHSTYPLNTLAKAITYAVLRKVFSLAINFDGNDVNQEIPITNYNDAGTANLVLVYKNAGDSTILVQNVAIVNDDTIATLALKAATGDITASIQGAFTNKLLNEIGYANIELERVIFKTLDRVYCDLNMLNEVMKVFVSSTIKLQNRTLAASAASFDTDRVDSQPLKGKLLTIKGVPKLKNAHVGASLFSLGSTTNGSMYLLRGAQMPAGHLEPKTKQDFQNCYASSNVSLQPGEIKTRKITMYNGSYFNNGFRALQGNQYSGKLTKIPGNSELFFFEELLNSGSTNRIHVQYEQQLYVSVYLVKGRSNAINTEHTQAQENNVPA